jgi:RNA polymerase sigma factor (sigma-70 family)
LQHLTFTFTENIFTKMSDKELLEAISHEDVNAFDELYSKYNKTLFRKAYIRVKNTLRAEDIMQEFWIDIWEHPTRIKWNQDGEAKGFLSSYLLFRILDSVRKESSNVMASEKKVSLDTIENEWLYSHVTEEYDIRELETVIYSILQKMPEKSAEIVMLHYRDGYTIKETADLLQMNERTVKYKSKECIAALKKILESKDKDATSFTVVKNASSCVVYIILMSDTLIS